jgi:hypothetical protein
MSSNFLTVKVKCKPLVKAYLESNFGNPVTIPDEHIIYKIATSQLFKVNSRPTDSCIDYPDDIYINISEKNFNYDGFNINAVNTRTFNTAVDNYIKNLTRTNLDSLLALQEQQTNWKKKYLDLIQLINKEAANKDLIVRIRDIKKELNGHEFSIKTAISKVIIDTLKLNFEVISYETVKKDYYRYRIKILNLNVPQPQ